MITFIIDTYTDDKIHGVDIALVECTATRNADDTWTVDTKYSGFNTTYDVPNKKEALFAVANYLAAGQQ